MKKIIAVFLMVALLVCCAGCKAYKNQAPTLYITLGDKEIEKTGSVVSYEKKGLFGDEAELSSYAFTSKGDYLPIYATDDHISFRFEEEPSAMSLRFYKMEDISKDASNAPSTQINAVDGQWPLQEGGNFYELWADWKNEVSSRTARYVFYILK